jgi:WD40 repeat protein
MSTLDIPAWEVLHAFTVGDHVQDLAWHASRPWVAIASISGPILVVDADSGQAVARLPGHEGGTENLAWQPRGDWLASIGHDGHVRLWHVETGETRALPSGDGWGTRVAWQSEGKFLASAAGRHLTFWKPDGSLHRAVGPLPRGIVDLAWKPGSKQLAVAVPGAIALWTPFVEEPQELREHSGVGQIVTWSPDGRFLATGDHDRTMQFWMPGSRTPLQMSGYPKKVQQLAWDVSSRWLATGGSDCVTVWDCSGAGPEGRTPRILEGHSKPLEALAAQHRGPLVASGASDAVVMVWRFDRGLEPRMAVALHDGVSALAWSSDDRYLAAGCVDGGVALMSGRDTPSS